MKVDLLGAKRLPSAEPTDQIVVPLVGLPIEFQGASWCLPCIAARPFLLWRETDYSARPHRFEFDNHAEVRLTGRTFCIARLANMWLSDRISLSPPCFVSRVPGRPPSHRIPEPICALAEPSGCVAVEARSHVRLSSHYRHTSAARTQILSLDIVKRSHSTPNAPLQPPAARNARTEHPARSEGAPSMG